MRWFLVLSAALVLATPVGAETVFLKIRAVPPDPEIYLLGPDGQALRLEYDVERRVYVLPLHSAGPVTLELRKVGHASQTVEVAAEVLKKGSPIVELPAAGDSLYFLPARPVDTTFHSLPQASVYLPVGGRLELLGSTGKPLPLAAAQPVEVVLWAPGYRSHRETVEPGATRWPAQGAIELRPVLPLVGPLIFWLTLHPKVTVSLLVLGLLVTIRVVRLLLRRPA